MISLIKLIKLLGLLGKNITYCFSHDAQTGHILCRAWRLCCVSPLLLSCLRASWLRLATSQAANSLRTIEAVIEKCDFGIFQSKIDCFFLIFKKTIKLQHNNSQTLMPPIVNQLCVTCALVCTCKARRGHVAWRLRPLGLCRFAMHRLHIGLLT